VNVVQDVYDYLLAQNVAGPSHPDFDLVRRNMTDETPVRDAVVVVAEDGGAQPEQPATSGIGDSAMSDAGVLVTVRAAALDGDASFTKAQEILDLLHGQHGVQLVSGGTQYLRIGALSEPIFAGFDDQQRPTHTVAFRLLAER
jgi:hypothetical protein